MWNLADDLSTCKRLFKDRGGEKVPTLTYTGKSIRLFDESHFRYWV
jgi:hypothetical protein